MQILKGVFHVVSRQKNSLNGNPRYLCAIHHDGFMTSFLTKPDSSLGYQVTNYNNKRVMVTLKLVRNKLSLIDIKTLDKQN